MIRIKCVWECPSSKTVEEARRLLDHYRELCACSPERERIDGLLYQSDDEECDEVQEPVEDRVGYDDPRAPQI